MKPKSLDIQISKLGQKMKYTELAKTALHTLRIKITTDSVPHQMSATIERHDGTQWHALASIHPKLMKSDSDLAYRSTVATEQDFAQDRVTLIGLAAAILD